MYTCKQDKNDYIRDYCKDIAFEVIKTRANYISANIYLPSSKMIQDLENMFGKFDKVAKSDALLYDPKFEIVISNSKTIFDEFLARFTSAITSFFATKRYHPQSGLEPSSSMGKSLIFIAKKEIKAVNSFVKKID